MKLMSARLTTVVLVLAMAMPAGAMRKPGDPIKPGFNLFSKQHDVQLGQQAAAEIRKKYQLVPNQELQDYIRRVGDRLASQKVARESGFPFTFALVIDKSVNAFALPGGPAFIHTGLILAADNEAQLAGVLAHELSHVILRHGTNQASKANLLQIPAILAGVVTGSNLLAQLTSLGATGFLLKFSRTAESEADSLGTAIMNDAGYNPIEMARFFEKLQAEGGSRAPEFLSDHPDPGNRVKAVQEEIRGLPQRQYGATVGDFSHMKSLVAKISPSQSSVGTAPAPGPALPVGGRPSGHYKQVKGREFALSCPDNWEVFGENTPSVTMAPSGGILPNGGGVAYGAITSFYVPKSQPGDLQSATAEFVQRLRERNPTMQTAIGPKRQITIEGTRGLVSSFSNSSSYPGHAEIDVLVTVYRPQGLFYMLFIAPQSEFTRLQETFDEMVRSIRFSN